MMRENGLVKLTEESAEVIQVAAKMIAYPELQHSETVCHPDGSLLRKRLEDELGDALAAIEFVTEKLELDTARINKQHQFKLNRFRQWDEET